MHRAEAPGWARFSSPSVADYSTPLSKSPPLYKSPLPRGGPSRTANCSPAMGGRSPHPPPSSNYTSSMGSLHSSLVYDSSRPRVMSHFTPLRGNRSYLLDHCDRSVPHTF